MNINANTAMDIMKILLAAGVAAWGIYEYYSKEHVHKIDRAQAYISEHVKIVDVKTAVDDFWVRNKIERDWDDNFKAESDITDWRYKQVTYEGIGQLIADDKQTDIRTKVHHLQHFYYNVAICLNDELCDLQTTCDSFFGDILDYRLKHIEYLKAFETTRMMDKDTQIKHLLQKCKQRQDLLQRALRKE